MVRQFGSWDERLQDDFFAKSWNSSRYQILSINGELCGYASVEETPDVITLHELVLLPNFQGKGIGSSMLAEVLVKAKETHRPARLQVLKENNAVKLYRKMGFREIEETDTHYLMEYDDSKQES